MYDDLKTHLDFLTRINTTPLICRKNYKYPLFFLIVVPIIQNPARIITLAISVLTRSSGYQVCFGTVFALLSSPIFTLQAVSSKDTVGLKYKSCHNDWVRKLVRCVRCSRGVKPIAGFRSLTDQVFQILRKFELWQLTLQYFTLTLHWQIKLFLSSISGAIFTSNRRLSSNKPYRIIS